MIKINDTEIHIGKFPDGTPNINFHSDNEQLFDGSETDLDDYDIEWKFDGMDELFYLQCLVDYLKAHDKYVRYLYLPYIPNARMDRVKGIHDVFTLKTFCNVINDMKFDKVFVNNAHSNVSLALLDNVVERGCEGNIESVLNIIKSSSDEYKIDTIFFPDEGATKRYSEYGIVKKYPIATGMKKRNWADGKILGLDVLADENAIKEKNILIVDDISSFGGTFKFSALKLKELGAKHIFLYITHCENVVDWKKLKEVGIERIFTTNSIIRMDKVAKDGEDPFDSGFIRVLGC